MTVVLGFKGSFMKGKKEIICAVITLNERNHKWNKADYMLCTERAAEDRITWTICDTGTEENMKPGIISKRSEATVQIPSPLFHRDVSVPSVRRLVSAHTWNLSSCSSLNLSEESADFILNVSRLAAGNCSWEKWQGSKLAQKKRKGFIPICFMFGTPPARWARCLQDVCKVGATNQMLSQFIH